MRSARLRLDQLPVVFAAFQTHVLPTGTFVVDRIELQITNIGLR